MTLRLKNEQVNLYREQGYLLVDQPLFSAERFSALKEHCESRMASWTEALGRPLEVIDRSHFIDPKLNEWLLADEVLDLVEPLIGPDIALFASSFINKLPGAGKNTVAWHDDAYYWKDLADRIEAVTVWLAIDPSTVQNGCMRVIPGTHKDGVHRHVKVTEPDEDLFSIQVEPDLIDESQSVDCVLESNHCSLHDAYLIHGSHAGGVTRRVGFQMRYMPTTIKATDHLGHQMYLARGRDHAGNDYGDPAKVNQKWITEHPEQQSLVDASRR